MARIRRDVWNLPNGDETLVWYARAVGAMQGKPIADPTSWRYQAAIHEYARASDPLRSPDDVLPSTSERKTFWTQCQHGSWFFLPWHRMYLHHFEKIVAAEVAKLNGPKDWALPYWNYSAGQASRLLPLAFRAPLLASGERNPLHSEIRNPGVNAGEPFADDRDVDLTASMNDDAFEGDSFGGSSSFGGPETEFEHGGQVIGSLEWVPHGSMHGAVGGWMGRFNTAALDPIFWLHHANIDRLWEVWLQRNGVHANPTNPKWLDGVSFQFHDFAGNVVAMTAREVIQSTAAPLDYQYEDTSDPLGGPVPFAAVPEGKVKMAKKPPSELAGATDRGLELSAETVHASLPIQAPPPAAGIQPEGVAPPRRVYLNIENLTAATEAPGYDVYVNVPPGEDADKHPELFAGRIPLFGLLEASQPSTSHAGSGLHYVLDVTELYDRLSTLPAWDASKLQVSFVPIRKHLPAGTVQVGRVSLYFG